MKKRYLAPVVLRKVALWIEEGVLTASVVNKVEAVKSMGQEVEQYDFSAPGNSFNHSWEN